MKGWLLIFLGAVFFSCSTGKKVVKNQVELPADDSASYEVIIMEPGYYSWAVTNAKPKWYLSYGYYKHYNQLYVNEWNARARTAGYKKPFDFFIEYDDRIDYGIDVEYQLYWYFKYMQQKYRFKLLVTERPLN